MKNKLSLICSSSHLFTKYQELHIYILKVEDTENQNYVLVKEIWKYYCLFLFSNIKQHYISTIGSDWVLVVKHFTAKLTDWEEDTKSKSRCTHFHSYIEHKKMANPMVRMNHYSLEVLDWHIISFFFFFIKVFCLSSYNLLSNTYSYTEALSDNMQSSFTFSSLNLTEWYCSTPLVRPLQRNGVRKFTPQV